MTGGASQVTSLVSTTLFARVSIRNESRGWSMPGPRKKLLSHLGNDFDGRFQRLYPGRRNGCGDAGAALPCHISYGDLLPGLDVVAVRFKASHAQCTASAQRVSDRGNST